MFLSHEESRAAALSGYSITVKVYGLLVLYLFYCISGPKREYWNRDAELNCSVSIFTAHACKPVASPKHFWVPWTQGRRRRRANQGGCSALGQRIWGGSMQHPHPR